MAMPWEKYQTAAPDQSGPWAKYAAPAEPADDRSIFQKAKDLATPENIKGAALHAGGFIFPGAQRELLLKQGYSPEQVADMQKTQYEQALNSATLGHLPNIVGGAKALVGDDYIKSRDAYQQAMDLRAKQNPSYATTGKIAGNLGVGAALTAVAPVAGIGALAEAPAAARMAAGTVQNLGTQGLLAFGEKPKDVVGQPSGLQIPQRLQQAKEQVSDWRNIGLSAAGPVLGEAASKMANSESPGMLSKIQNKLGEKFASIPEEATKTYKENMPTINKEVQQMGGDINIRADAARDKIQAAFDEAKANNNKVVETFLRGKQGEKLIDPSDILDKLEEHQSQLNTKLPLQKDAFDEIEKQKKIIESLQNENGMIAAKDLHGVKQELYNASKGSFNGQNFVSNKETSVPMKQAALVTKDLINEAVPDVKAANENLSKLHDIDEYSNVLMNKDRPINQLISAGINKNPKIMRAAKALEEVSGHDIPQEIKNLAAFNYYNSPAYSLSGAGLLKKGLMAQQAIGNAGQAIGNVAGPIVSPIATPLIGAAQKGLITPLGVQSQVRSKQEKK